MFKIYVDFYAGFHSTFTLVKGPEPEGTKVVGWEVFKRPSRSAEVLRPLLVWWGTLN